MDTGTSRKLRPRQTGFSYEDSGSSGDDNQDKDEDYDCGEVGQEYKRAASALKEALKVVLQECKPGTKIVALCEKGDDTINVQADDLISHEMSSRGVAFPTCISVNKRICNVSPTSSYDELLADGDVVRINMACHINGYVATVAHTHVVKDEVTGSLSPLISAATKVLGKGLLNHVAPGVRVYDICNMIRSSVELHGYMAIKINCHKLKHFCYPDEALESDILINYDADSFEENQAYTLEIVIGRRNVELYELDKENTTVYKMVMSRQHQRGEGSDAYKIIRNNFSMMPFTTRALKGEDFNCVMKHRNFLRPYPVLFTKDEPAVVHFKNTILVKKNGAVKLTGQRPKFEKPAQGENRMIRDKLVYLGKLAIGEKGSFEVPAISALSWNSIPGRLELACSGSFGTYIYRYTYHATSAVDAPLDDIEQGWSKTIASDIPAKICQWAPLCKDYLALGSVGVDGTGRVTLYDPANNLETLAYAFSSGSDINSLSWNSTGEYLLATCNNTKKITILRITGKNEDGIASKAVTLDCFIITKFAKGGRDLPTKADYFGVFHPTQLLIFTVSSSGILGLYGFDEVARADGALPWKKLHCQVSAPGFTGISVSCDGHILACSRTDGKIYCIRINYVKLNQGSSRIWDYMTDITVDSLVDVQWSRFEGLGGYLAVIDTKELVTIYEEEEELGSEMSKLCTNEEDATNKSRNQHDAIAWKRDGLLSSGGEGGFIHFWEFQPSPIPRFATKRRDHFGEKQFYTSNKQMEYGVGKELEDDIFKFATLYSGKIDGLEATIKEMKSIARSGLSKIYSGVVLTSEETVKILEDIMEAGC